MCKSHLFYIAEVIKIKIYNVYQSGKNLYIDEKENPDKKIVVNKYDNMQQTLRLVSDDTLPPRLYWALRNPKLSNKYFILKLINNEDIIIGTDISAHPGLWDMLLIGTDDDYIIEGTDIDQSRLTYVSNHFGRLFVRDNFLEELDFEEQRSPTFEIFYDEIIDELGNKVDNHGWEANQFLATDNNGNVVTKSGGSGGMYILPVANENKLGGVKPLNKTNDMTQEVGVDSNGRLFAKGSVVTVDSDLSETSKNPLENQVITKELNKFGGTVEITEGNPEKENTVLTINPNSESIDIYNVDEVNTIRDNLKSDIDNKINKSGHAPNMLLGTDENGNVVTKESSAGGGKDGASAYEVAVENGFEGTEEEWLESLQGEDGYTPKKGVDYWTEKDIEVIKSECKTYIDTEILGGAS